MRSIFGRARDPDNAPLMVAGRQVIRPNKQPGGPAPGIEAAFEIFGACASSTQPRGNALSEREPAPADHYDGAARIAARPGHDGAMIAPLARRQKTPIVGEVDAVGDGVTPAHSGML
jgi:hypothetical protein